MARKKRPKLTAKEAQARRSAQLAAGAASLTTLGVTAAITAAVAKVQSQPFDCSLWNPAFFARDTPINQMPILTENGFEPKYG